jgi:hypothetical protein
MRLATSASLVIALALSACAPIAVNGMQHATQALEPRTELQDTIDRYLSDVRYGRIDEASGWVDPALQDRFKAKARKLADVRFTDAHVESLTFTPDNAAAEAVIVYRGYWLSSPFEREIRVVQHWYRQRSFAWMVVPDLDAVVAGPGSPQPPAALAE